MARDPLRLDLDGQRPLANLTRQRRHQPLIGQERRVDPAGQVSKVLQGLGRFPFDLFEHPVRSLRVLR